jgi:hypothetical protein
MCTPQAPQQAFIPPELMEPLRDQAAPLDAILAVVAKDSPLYSLVRPLGGDLCADVSRDGKRCKASIGRLLKATQHLEPPREAKAPPGPASGAPGDPGSRGNPQAA